LRETGHSEALLNGTGYAQEGRESGQCIRRVCDGDVSIGLARFGERRSETIAYHGIHKWIDSTHLRDVGTHHLHGAHLLLSDELGQLNRRQLQELGLRRVGVEHRGRRVGCNRLLMLCVQPRDACACAHGENGPKEGQYDDQWKEEKS